MDYFRDDDPSFSTHTIIAAAITAAELAEVLHSPAADDGEQWALHADQASGFGDAYVGAVG